ncbi:hypothetical protein E1A91_D01G153700v1 [Gossypium mustelinum]|uniref:Reverse transcriptase domain-containing protein n=1 Tax=Gossypium mustelinum TaxID=34275 RepID=A0A5D2W7P1_GOSMU|nr:hypothetical protein E1A91_D01G153700v1 [Gossypium mustelinum]
MGKGHKTHLPLFSKVIRSLRSKHKNINWMAVKIDLEKAYDGVH